MNQELELTADKNIDIIFVEEHEYNDNELNLKHHDSGTVWTLRVKRLRQSVIGGVGMLLRNRSLKSPK